HQLRRRGFHRAASPLPRRPGAHSLHRRFSLLDPTPRRLPMPQPYPGQKWKHGWIPLTPGAAREKNHGKKPGGGSLIARMVAEAAETHQRMLARDREREAKASATRAATRSADDALRSAAKNRPAQTVEAMPSAPAAPTKAAGMRDGLRWTSDEDGLAWARKNLPLPDLTDDEKKSIRQYTRDE